MDQGSWIVTAAATTAFTAAFILRTRAPSALVTAVLVAAGAGIGWGGMLLQRDPTTGELVAAVVMLALLVPAHVHIVLGPFGPRR